MKYLLQEILFPATHFDKLDSIDDFIRKLHSLVSSLHNLFLEPVRGLGFEILIKLESFVTVIVNKSPGTNICKILNIF